MVRTADPVQAPASTAQLANKRRTFHHVYDTHLSAIDKPFKAAVVRGPQRGSASKATVSLGASLSNGAVPCHV
jgi:hypothetical protein